MWWKNAVFYEIYVASFSDSNEDGRGDLQGIRDKIPYLKGLGIDGIWLTPFYPSPKVDNGYDISDYYAVASEYGTLEDFEQLIEAAHDNGIKIIVDLVINHTSTEHPWFKESKRGKDSPKRDWYIWKSKPNNWESFFGGCAWEYDEKSQDYYYHSFSKEQADLNWTNSEVKKAVFDVIDFWIGKGLDGFRLDVINNLSTSDVMTDNPNDDDGQQIHLHDVNQKGIIPFVKELKTYLNSYDKELFTVGEISSDNLSIIEKYSSSELLDVTFNFNFGSQENFDEMAVFGELQRMLRTYNDGRRATYFFNSHDMSRSWNRLANMDLTRYLQLATLVLLNDGVSFLYQGEELGLGDFVPASLEEVRDVQAINKYYEEQNNGKNDQKSLEIAQLVNRDKSRGMMPWEEDTLEYWIGLSTKNSEEKEIFRYYQTLIKLRKEYISCDTKMFDLNLEDKILSYKIGTLEIELNFKYDEELSHTYGDSEALISQKGIYIGKRKNA
jgi:trehalose-6-phosphate hydrolase